MRHVKRADSEETTEQLATGEHATREPFTGDDSTVTVATGAEDTPPGTPDPAARERVILALLAAACGGVTFVYAEQMLELIAPTTEFTALLRAGMAIGVTMVVLALTVLGKSAVAARAAKATHANDSGDSNEGSAAEPTRASRPDEFEEASERFGSPVEPLTSSTGGAHVAGGNLAPVNVESDERFSESLVETTMERPLVSHESVEHAVAEGDAPTIRSLKAQIRSLEESLFRQSAKEAGPAQPLPEVHGAATRDEVTREVLERVRTTIRGLRVRMDGDPGAAEVLARVDAAVARLAETGFYLRPALPETGHESFDLEAVVEGSDASLAAQPDLETAVASVSVAELPAVHVPAVDLPVMDPAMDVPVTDLPVIDLPGTEAGLVQPPPLEQPVVYEVDVEVAAVAPREEHLPEAPAMPRDQRGLAERLASEAAAVEAAAAESAAAAQTQTAVLTVDPDVVLPVPAGPPAPPIQRGRRWGRRTPSS